MADISVTDLANIVADTLLVRDDIANAEVTSNDTIDKVASIQVETQGGKRFGIYVGDINGA